MSAAGFSGDGGPAISAQLHSPNALAFDSGGNLYIADTTNNRIRKVDLTGTITTIAGSSGTPGFGGDGGPATAALLNRPDGVAADSAGNILIGDSGNNVVRKVDLFGNISTVAGKFSLGAGYTGDGGAATNAQLNAPQKLSVSAGSELFICDRMNSVVHRVDGSGKISTYMISTPVTIPVDAALDGQGNLAIVDLGHATIVEIARNLPAPVQFPNQIVDTPSAAIDITATNIGNQPLAFSQITEDPGFNISGADTSCSTSSPVGSGLDCILGVVFLPTRPGGFDSALRLRDNSLGPVNNSSQIIPLRGTGIQTSTTTSLTASPNPAFEGQTVTLTATVAPPPTGESLGAVQFCLGGGSAPVPVGKSGPTRLSSRRTSAVVPDVSSCGLGTALGDPVNINASGVATLMIANLPQGADSIIAIYLGNPAFATSTSDPFVETINPLTSTTTTLMISPSTAFAGQTITLTGTVAPVPTGSPLGTITFCDAGTPRGIRVQRNPASAKTPHSSPLRPEGGLGNPCGLDTPLGSSDVNSSGSASIAVSNLTAGGHSIYAVYSGNVAVAGSVSPNVNATVNLAYTVTAPQTPFDVPEGGSVQIAVNVPPLGGAFDSTVTMSASGLPPKAAATFTPPTVTPGAAGMPTTLTIQLAPIAAARPVATALPLLGGLGMLLAVANLRKRPRLRLAAVLLFVSLVSAGALALTGCNAGFAGLSTPKGQFVVTIIGTSGPLHPSTTVTVVVQ